MRKNILVMTFTSAAQGPEESKKSHAELQLNLPSASISQQTIPKPKVIQETNYISNLNVGMALDPADPSLFQNEYFLNEKKIYLEYNYTLLHLLLPHWEAEQKRLAHILPLVEWACSSLPLKNTGCDSSICK